MRGSPISASSTPDGIREGSERLLARFDAVRVSSRAHFLFLTGDVAIALPLWASWALKMRCIRADRTARLYLLSRPRSWPGLVRWTRVVEQSIAGRELTPHDAALRSAPATRTVIPRRRRIHAVRLARALHGAAPSRAIIIILGPSPPRRSLLFAAGGARASSSG